MAANNEKRCRVCKRILVGDSKLGVCPDCINKYGTPLVALTATGGLIVIGFAVKNGKKIINIVKNIGIFKM